MMKKGVLFVLTAASLASCQQEENEGVASVDRVTTTPIIIRATEVNLEDQDQIGSSIIKENGIVYATNELTTFNDGTFAGSLKRCPEGVDKSSFMAYYPHSATGVSTSFTAHADQTTNYGISGFMAASKSNVPPSMNSISMIFKHILIRLVTNVTNEANLDTSSVMLKGSVSTTNVNLTAMETTVNEGATATDVTTQQVTRNKTFRAIIAPQTAASILTVTTPDSNTLIQKFASTDLVQGGQYSANIRVLSDNIIVTPSGEIKNWTDEGEIKGDKPEVSFREHDEYFAYDGIAYNTVTPSNGTTWMAEPLRHVPDGYIPSSNLTANSRVWYPYELITADGTLTARVLRGEASIEQYGYLYDTHVVLSGKAATPEDCYDFEGARGICPKGWHVPTRVEYFSLVNNSIKDMGGSSLEDGKDALSYDIAYDGGRIPTLNEAKFNHQFSGVYMSTGYSATPKHQATVITSSNSAATEWFGKSSMSYYMISTAYKPIYNTSTDGLINTQFFGLMSTSPIVEYPGDRLSLSYINILSGQTVHCVENQNQKPFASS